MAPAISGYAYGTTALIIHQQLDESPLQNSSQSQSNWLNKYNSIHDYCNLV